MSNPTGAFIWYELLTTDADAAQKFYSSVVGWRITDSGMPDMDYRVLNAGDAPVGGLMALSRDMLDGGARPVWLGYVMVDDVDATIASVTKAGGRLMLPPSDIENVGRFAMVSDPQGIPMYVMHDTSGRPSRAFEERADGHCAWNELATPDQAAALDFYTGQFGWKLGETMSMGEMGDYQMIDVGDTTIGGVMTAADGWPAMWRYYFRVPDLKAAIDETTSGGGQILHGPQEVPGDDEIVIAMDPQGATFALVATKA
jgi:uncharacterized protein